MSAYKWYLPTFGEIMTMERPAFRASVAPSEIPTVPDRQHYTSRSRREWYGAIAGLNDLLVRSLDASPTLSSDGDALPMEGLVISGPLPVLSESRLISRFSSWTLTGSADPLHPNSPPQLLPASHMIKSAHTAIATLPLMPDDPLGAEPFCLVLTADFSLVMALSTPTKQENAPAQTANNAAKRSSQRTDSHQAIDSESFMFSFTPEVVWQCWRALRSRMEMTVPSVVTKLDTLVNQFAPVTPDYRLVSDFSHLMLANMPEPIVATRSKQWRQNARPSAAPRRSPSKKLLNLNLPKSIHNHSSFWKPASAAQIDAGWRSPWEDSPEVTDVAASRSAQPSSSRAASSQSASSHSIDAELLRAIAHEVRTPLSTIRTMTRLLLRRKDLAEQVMKRLAVIDRECTKQIDRFGLIFRAVELETQPANTPLSPLAAISLDQVLQQNMMRWRQQAEQHNLTLDVVLPHRVPVVLSDPTMLDQVLTGLIDRLTHTLPAGSHIEMRVVPAGNQLKLQFYSRFGSAPKGINAGADQDLSSDQPPTVCDFSMSPSYSIFDSTLQSVGQLLMFQPETGNLSLNLDVTKNLFQALGGKFTVRQYPQQGEVLTIFLPVDESSITI